MSQTKYCENCHSRFHEETHKFCGKCGTELSDLKPCVFKFETWYPSRCPDCNGDTLRYRKKMEIVVCTNFCELEWDEVVSEQRLPVYGRVKYNAGDLS